MTNALTTDKAARAMLYRKISAVTAAVHRIPKNGHNTFHNYKYATESDITDGLRDLLAEHGLAFLPPSVLAWERDEVAENPKLGPRTRIQMQFEIGCCESGEVYTAIVWGEGQDTSDKGFYKAYTGAVKYFLMKTFLIATGDDPEQGAQGAHTGKASYHAPPAERSRPQGDVRLCAMHRIPMKPGKNGGWYCPKKLDSGEWCTGRSLKEDVQREPEAESAPSDRAHITELRDLWRQSAELGRPAPAKHLTLDLEALTAEQIARLADQARGWIAQAEQSAAEPAAA